MQATLHNYRDTSLAAYSDVDEDDKKKQYWRILHAVNEFGEMSNSEICRFTGIKINMVTPRVYEMRGLDKNTKRFHDGPVLVQARKRKCMVTNKEVNTWKIGLPLNEAVRKIQ